MAVEPSTALVERYRRQLDALRPPGLAGRFKADGVWAKLMRGLAVELARVDMRGDDLLREADPSRATELLVDWERVLGLPDPCADDVLSMAARRAAIAGRLAARGGASPAYFVEVANALGYDPITIEEHSPWRIGINAMGDEVGGDEWSHHWTVHAPLFSIFFFLTGTSTMGEALNLFDSTLLECTLERIKPAHTVVHFAYDLDYQGYAPWGTVIAPSPAKIVLQHVPPGVLNTIPPTTVNP